MSTDIICQVDIDTKLIVEEFKSIDDVIPRFPQFLEKSIKNCIRKCLTGERKLFGNFGWIYKSQLDELTMEKFVKDKKTKKLFVDLFPELVKELNPILNKDIDISKLTYGSNTVLYWDCFVDKTHPTYDTVLYDRTRPNGPSGCPECGRESIKLHNSQRPKVEKEKVVITKEEKAEYIKNYVQKVDNVIKGDKIEKYVENLLVLTSKFSEIERVGNTGDATDIIVTLNSGIRKAIQIKSMIFIKNDRYSVGFSQDYPEKMLIVMINETKDKFALVYKGDIKVTNLSLSFNYKRAKYKNIMYTDQTIFLEKLLELIPNSCDYTEFVSSSSTAKEYYSLKRLKQWCIEKKLEFERNETDGNSVDCFINGIPMQHKFKSLNYGHTFKIPAVKSAGTLKGKEIKRPYSIDDPFEYFVVEIGGTENEPEKYRGYFCFIPKIALSQLGVLKTDTTDGTGDIRLHPPDYPEEHWSKNYWYNLNTPLIL